MGSSAPTVPVMGYIIHIIELKRQDTILRNQSFLRPIHQLTVKYNVRTSQINPEYFKSSPPQFSSIFICRTTMKTLLIVLLIATLYAPTLAYDLTAAQNNVVLNRQVDGIIEQIDRLGQLNSDNSIRQYLVYKMNKTSNVPLCSGPSSYGQLSSGQITINSAGNGASQYTYTYSQSLTSIDRSLASVSMNSFNVQFSNLVSFSIVKSQNKGTGFNFTFESMGNSRWSSMKINFVVSDRTDIELGSAVYDSSLSSEGIVRYGLKNQWEDSSRLEVVAFLTGFEGASNSGSIGYLITGHSIANNVLTLTLKFQTNTKVTKLALDLVILDPFNSALRFQHRQIVDTFVSSTQISFLPPVQPKEQRIQMLGVSAFAIEDSIQLSLQSQKQTGQNYSLLKYGPQGSGCSFNYLSLAYLAVSFNPCGFCPGQTFTHQGQCLKKCPFGFRPNSNFQCEPIVCPEGSYLHPDNTCHTCPSNTIYSPVQGKCIPRCGSNERYDTVLNKCVCIDGYYMLQGGCGQCPAGYRYESSTMKCVALCGEWEQWVGSQCMCIGGYYRMDDGQCRQCPVGTQYDSSDRKCKPVCGVNQTLVNGRCVCRSGYYLIGGRCQNCPQNTIYDSSRGICRVPCTSNQQYSFALSKCICISGYYLINNQCQQCPPGTMYDPIRISCRIICATNEEYSYSQNKCVCVDGYYRMSNNQCQKCPSNTIYDSTIKTCRVECKANEQYSPSAGKCICVSGYYLINQVCQKCPQGYFFDFLLNICRVPCGDNEIYNQSLKRCVCQNGYYFINNKCQECPKGSVYDDSLKTCRPDCGPNEQYSIAFGRCVCVSGYYLIGGRCQQCPSGTIYDSTRGICRVPCGANQQFSFAQNKCVCVSGYYWINSRCQQCPPGTMYDSNRGICRIICSTNEQYSSSLDKCICINGFYWINNRCQQCPPGTVYDSTRGTCRIICSTNEEYSSSLDKCVCISGYYLINHRCQQCHPGTVYDQSRRTCRIICSSNQQYSYSLDKCVCVSGYYWINNRCQQCPPGSIYDQSTGSCRPLCGPNQQYSPTLSKCVCVSGYYWINNQCQQCPSNTHYDMVQGICVPHCGQNQEYSASQQRCVCKTGFYIINGVCGVCQFGRDYDSILRKCVLTCLMPNEVYDSSDDRCVCKDNYVRVNGQCQMCRQNQFYYIFPGGQGKCFDNCPHRQYFNPLTTRCECSEGYYNISGSCSVCPSGQVYEMVTQTCIPSCPHRMTYSVLKGKCVCIQGFGLRNGYCMDCGPCSQVNPFSGLCQCAPTYYWIEGVCGTCPIGSRYNSGRQICEVNCPPYSTYDELTGRCICQAGYNMDWKNNLCISTCPEGQYYSAGQCQCNNPNQVMWNHICYDRLNCPENSYFHVESYCCLCNPGYRFVEGKCVNFNCGANSYDYNGLCVCKNGYFMVNNQCVMCGSNEVYDGIECVCRSGTEKNSQGVCVVRTIPICGRNQVYSYADNKCVCVQGCQYLMGKCEIIPSCPLYAFFNGASCVCQTGYLMQNGRCVPVETPVPSCPANSEFNGVSCVCKSGFYQVRPGQCGTCPAGSFWNGYQCSHQKTCEQGYVVSPFNQQCIPVAQLCGPGAKWNGASCCCLPGYNLIENRCIQCQAGTWFDGRTCSSFSNFTNSCPSNQLKISGDCQCAPSFYRIGGLCTQCPSFTQWNGLYCETTNSDSRKWCMGVPYSIQTSMGCECQQGYFKLDGLCIRY